MATNGFAVAERLRRLERVTRRFNHEGHEDVRALCALCAFLWSITVRLNSQCEFGGAIFANVYAFEMDCVFFWVRN